MSQRVFRYANYEVLTGWDNPLQYYFLIIEDINTDEEEEYLVFNNLKRDNPGMTLEEIKEVLVNYGIIYPKTLFDDLKNNKDDSWNYGKFPYTYEGREE